MSERLPERVDALHLAEAGQIVTGQVSLSKMYRLAPLLATTEGVADISLEFGRDGPIRYARGRIGADLQIICQRCLQAMAFRLDAAPKLGLIISAQQAERLPEGYEPLLVSEQLIPLAEIVEDEIILGLPTIARHDDEHCAEWQASPDPFPETPRRNPFAVLGPLKNNK